MSLRGEVLGEEEVRLLCGGGQEEKCKPRDQLLLQYLLVVPQSVIDATELVRVLRCAMNGVAYVIPARPSW